MLAFRLTLLYLLYPSKALSESSTEPSTTSLSCYWLGDSFATTDKTNEYKGTCCTSEAVEELENSEEWKWLLKSEETTERWNGLTQFLFCVKGACSDPSPVWTNCTG